MRNNPVKAKSKNLLALAEKLPFFTLANFANRGVKKSYLKILFSRYKKTGKFIRLKKGLYVCREYIANLQKNGRFDAYPEFVAGILYPPAYLSLDYVLYQHNLLTEVVRSYAAVTISKTARFVNAAGNFYYHKIRKELFNGYKIVKINDFTIFKATKAKALFDFLYFRKNDLVSRKTVQALRLNMNNFNYKDQREFKKYLRADNSVRMRAIFKWLKK